MDQCQHLRHRFKAYFCALRAQHAAPKPLNVIASAWLAEVAVTSNGQPLPTLLSDAFNFYINNHKNGSDQQFKRKQHSHWQRLIDLVGDISLDGLTREHARRYRDNRLTNHIKQPSVQREISSIKAIINVARREIPLSMSNPFDGLVVTAPTEQHKATRRLPYSRDEVLLLLRHALGVDDERRRIVVLLVLTGARLAEIVGLRRQDVENNAIHITEHASRSLKTSTSNRIVPLHPLALEAVNKQLEAHDGDYLFPSYCNDQEVKANSASAAINKWAGGLVKGKTMHSFRHTMRDQLREVGCPDSVAKEIGGWANGKDVSAGYGQGSSVNVKRKWLEHAYSWVQA